MRKQKPSPMKMPSILFLLFFTTCFMAKYVRLDQTDYYTKAASSLTVCGLIILFFITLLIGKIFMLRPHSSKYSSNINFNNHQSIAPHTAFVFDLHGVVFRFSPLKAASDALHTTHKKKLFWAALNPFLIWDVLKLLHTSAVVEEAIMGIGHKYPSLANLIPLALQMANEQVPIEPTVQLMTQLKKSGFKLFVFSNIGEHSAQILQAKYPQIFALFDGILVTTAQDNYLMKPSEQAFVKFLNKFNFSKEQIVFIDDKLSNIDAARKMGISAIQFINPSQCKQLLQQIHAIT